MLYVLKSEIFNLENSKYSFRKLNVSVIVLKYVNYFIPIGIYVLLAHFIKYFNMY